ncbi:carbonate dehydratase [Gigaspora margarita]|uniref:Carbonic anhydrase n=1 Tax=Gigaspora margarita TaxID=4874 RepID=A0A8H3X951_GIGMA|nr:carbonate dehydratase [Gigaspora margarita]
MDENENADNFKDAEETLNINKSGRKIMRAQSEMGFLDDHAPRTSIDIITPLPISFSEVGESLEGLLENNKKWAKTITAQVPTFFANHAKGQKPKIVWIGCSDSRVPAETVVQLGPGEIFVHRNIANQFNHTDLNSLSVLQYAVDHLKVEHIIVCGHYGCGGVLASMSNQQHGLVDHWLRNIKDVYCANKSEIDALPECDRANRMVELNVVQQVYNIAATNIVQNVWEGGRKLEVHGWVYDLGTGLIKDLEMNIREAKDLRDQIFQVLFEKIS